MSDGGSQARLDLLRAAGSKLRLDAAIAQAMLSFEHAGIDARLLKGPAIAQWLYVEREERSYIDGDVLIDPAQVALAEEMLESIGYRRHFDDRAMPSWWREHGGDWVRERDGVTIDLHRTLPGVRADPGVAWDLLAMPSEYVAVAGEQVQALRLPARALHVALHAAHHGVAMPQPLRDLERALAVSDADLWCEAAALATRLGATEAFAAGLRLSSAGTGVADRLGLPRMSSVDAQLRATSAPPAALSFEQLTRASGVREQVAIVWRKLFPPAEFVRHWDPRARQSRLALVRAYARRPFWILSESPDAFRSWYRARRAVRARRHRRG